MKKLFFVVQIILLLPTICRSQQAGKTSNTVKPKVKSEQESAYEKELAELKQKGWIIIPQVNEPKCARVLRFNSIRKHTVGTSPFMWKDVAKEGKILFWGTDGPKIVIDGKTYKIRGDEAGDMTIIGTGRVITLNSVDETNWAQLCYTENGIQYTYFIYNWGNELVEFADGTFVNYTIEAPPGYHLIGETDSRGNYIAVPD